MTRPSIPEAPCQMSPRAGKPADPSMYINVPRLVTAYYTRQPDAARPAERVAFGTSGHRGSALDTAFNEGHILAVTEAICLYRKRQKITGPLFLGIDTHALSESAAATALEVLAAHGIDVMIAENDEYTPTPAVSHAILTYNRGRTNALADGIVVTPSHNPPEDGGFKYNPPHGGPAGTDATGWIQSRANELLEGGLESIPRIPYARALRSPTTHRHDYMSAYVDDLAGVVDLDVIRESTIRIGVDPLGGAGIHYWGRIAERYGLELQVVNDDIDPAFRFMTADWDGKIRMDPSSPYAMSRLIGLKDCFDLVFACDTDHGRFGIVAPSVGLMPPNHFLSAAVSYLSVDRSEWPTAMSVGKTVVSSSMIDRVAAKSGLGLYEVPVGFKWFVDGLLAGSLGFCGEESAGAAFLRRDGTVWTTDKDGIIACLLAAEMTARTSRDPGELYRDLAREFGAPVYERIDVPATPKEKSVLRNLSPEQIHTGELAGQKIRAHLTSAPGNGKPIGGLKVSADDGWFAVRPSGTEDVYKIYAESFGGMDHLRQIQSEARSIVNQVLAVRPPPLDGGHR